MTQNQSQQDIDGKTKEGDNHIQIPVPAPLFDINSVQTVHGPPSLLSYLFLSQGMTNEFIAGEQKSEGVSR